MPVRPDRVTIEPPPSGIHRHREALGAVDVAALGTTVGSEQVVGVLHTGATAAAQIDIVSAAGATDDGRVIELDGILVDGWARVVKQVTLDASGEASIPIGDGWLDVVRMRDVSDELAPAANAITASAGGQDLCEIVGFLGISASSRDYVPDGQVAYLQSMAGDSTQLMLRLALFAQPQSGGWYAVNNLLNEGPGATASRVVFNRTYDGPTTRGIRIPGPARIEVRARTALAAVLTMDYRILCVPTTQDAL